MNNLRLVIIIGIALVCFSCQKSLSFLELPSSFTEMDGVKIHYKVHGETGPDIVFIHGWSCDMDSWKHQFEFFKDKARLIFIDLPGHGKSSVDEVEYSQDFFAASVKKVLDELQITKPIMVGHSMGFTVSRQVVRNYPELESKICSIDGLLLRVPKDSANKAQYLGGLKMFAEQFSPENRQTGLENFYKVIFIPTTPPEVKDYAKNVLSTTPDYVAYNSMLYTVQEELWEEDMHNVPTMAIYANTPQVTDDFDEYLGSLLPNLEFHLKDSVGHFIMMEKPEEFNQLLHGFIEDK